MLAAVSVAAATAVLGYDLMTGNKQRSSKEARVLRGAALAGSAAALDTKVELYKGTTLIAELFNTATGAPTRDHLFPVGSRIAPDEEITATVTDAPGTNPINLLIDFA